MSGLYVKLDVNYFDDPKVTAVSTDAEVLFVRSLCYCKRLLSDGFIAESQLRRIASDIGPPIGGPIGADSDSESLAKELVSVGLWTDVPGGWRITAWAEHNDLAEEVEQKRRAKQEGGVLGNHKRWHVGKVGTPSPDCPYCDSHSDRSTDPQPTRLRSPETETETETETEKQHLAPAARKPRKPDLLFEALVEACNLDPSELTKSARGRVNRAVKELRDIQASPEGVRARAEVHRQRWPNAEVTPTSLAANYAQLGTPQTNGFARDGPSKAAQIAATYGAAADEAERRGR